MGPSHHRRRRRIKLYSAGLTVAIAFLLLASLSGALCFNPSRKFSVGLPARRRLGGPGSWPPTCRSKCGWCGPCEPVHVPIRPGFSMPMEYYPEAWRCKCGDKLFMP